MSRHSRACVWDRSVPSPKCPVSQNSIITVIHISKFETLFWAFWDHIWSTGPSRATDGPGKPLWRGPITISFRMRQNRDAKCGKSKEMWGGVSPHHPTMVCRSIVSSPSSLPLMKMDFVHIWDQKKAIWNTLFSIFERWWGPPNVAGPGKTFPHLSPSRRAWWSMTLHTQFLPGDFLYDLVMSIQTINQRISQRILITRDTALTWFSRVISAMSSCMRRFSRSAISRPRPASVSSSPLASSWRRRLTISRSFAAVVSFWRLVHTQFQKHYNQSR